MDFEQELNHMIDSMTARVGRCPDRIIMHPDTARSMVSHTNDLAGGGEIGEGYIARYSGIPVTLSDGVEPNKFYLTTNPSITDYNAWWLQSPYGSSTAIPYMPSVSFVLDTYEAKKPDEEPDEIDESSFMDILNAGE